MTCHDSDLCDDSVLRTEVAGCKGCRRSGETGGDGHSSAYEKGTLKPQDRWLLAFSSLTTVVGSWVPQELEDAQAAATEKASRDKKVVL